MLPISKYKDAIISSVHNYDFTIVSAETGSGKSTQIPQYLSQYYQKVIVTEPRIMAAKTLAKRVAEEMNVELGQEVGYRTAYDKCDSVNSKILFCTDGLQRVRSMLGFSYNSTAQDVLIIDEAHEWNLNIETLVAWCKLMMDKWNTKVVIMSATMDTDELADFFGESVNVLSIPGTLYDVKVEERLKYEFINTIKEKIRENKNILVFVAGKKEINNVIDELKYENATVLPLHGEMDWEEQKRCFGNYENSKVIVATNVAQTSLTIPDIDVVIDTGEARMTFAEDGIQGLFLRNISKADIFQRKGRAGRTKNGEYILCSDERIEDRPEYTIPEIQRSILDRVVLQLASIGLDAERLSFYHQPEINAIRTAKKELNNLGAIDSNNNVTPVGYKMVKIPVSPQMSRMIVESEKYGVTESVVVIAAIIEMGGLLTKEGRYSQFTSENKSDLLAELDVWNSISQKEYINFKELGIKKKTFFKIKEHLKKLKQTLYGIVEMTTKHDRNAILKSCLAGLISHLYISTGFRAQCSDEFGNYRILDKSSCINLYNHFQRVFLVGIPKTFEYESYWGMRQMDLIVFASTVDISTVMELNPSVICETVENTYSASADAVCTFTTRSFAGFKVSEEIHYDRNHSDYQKLKMEYEQKLREEIEYNAKERRRLEELEKPKRAYEMSRQSHILIDGKVFNITYLLGKPFVYIDEETLYTTEVDTVFLENGDIVSFQYPTFRENTSIKALRSLVEFSRITNLRKDMRYKYTNIKSKSINDVVSHKNQIGKVKLTTKNGGYSDEPIFVYGCIHVCNKSVSFEIVSDEETAKSNTAEALQHLFMKEVESKFGATKFSHEKGKSVNILLIPKNY